MGLLHASARGAAVVAIVLCASAAHAQSAEEAVTQEVPRKLRILLGTEAVLHATDMLTTTYGLKLGGIEANPLLAPLSGRPAALAAVSSGINVLQIYTIVKLHRRHPKVAVAWALILIGAETYAVTNNIKVAGNLQRTRAGTR